MWGKKQHHSLRVDLGKTQEEPLWGSVQIVGVICVYTLKDEK